MEETPRHANRFWSKVTIGDPKECWEWKEGRFTRGYGSFWLNGRSVISSRVAWELSFGPIPRGMIVCHACDNPPCCNPAHLWIGTDEDNMTDRDTKGRQASGDRNGSRTKPGRLVRGDDHWTKTDPEGHGMALAKRLTENPELRARGERCGKAKFTNETVIDIKRRLADGESQSSIARSLGVWQTTIGQIALGKAWAHLQA